MADDQRRRDDKRESNGKLGQAVRPKMLYTDNGDQFKVASRLASSAEQLAMPSVHTELPRPRGRGKIERLFGSIDPQLPNSDTSE